MTVKPALSAAALLGAAVLLPGTAAGQSVNYGVLSEIFAEPVTTSATGQPQLASDVPASLTILSAEDIRRFGARSLPDVLTQVMGVDVLTWAAGAQDVGLRGLTMVQNPRVLVLVNGRQVYLEHVGTPKWSGIPVQLSEIRQIEVVRGPQSALFGFNAVSGVINIVTFNPLLDNRNEVEVTLGSGRLREASAVATLHPMEGLGIRVSAGVRSVGEYGGRELDRILVEGSDTAERATLSVDALLQVTPDVQVGTEFTFSDWRNIEVEGGLDPQFGIYETGSARLYAKADTGIGLVDANVYVNRLDFDLRNTALIDSLAAVNSLAVAQVQTLKRLTSRLSMRLGAEYRESEMDVPGVSGAEIGYSVWSGSGMLDWDIHPDLNAVLAIRQDAVRLERSGIEVPPFRNTDYSRSLHPFSYNASLIWRATADDTVRASVGRGNQSLSLSELGLNGTVADTDDIGIVVVSGNPELDPTEVTQIELGWTRRLAPVDGKFIANVYYQDFQNLTILFGDALLPVAGTQLISYGNLGDQRIWGVEAAVDGRAGPYRAGLSYSWADGDLALDISLPGLNVRPQSPRIDLGDQARTHTVKASAGWMQGDWSVDLLAVWQSASGADLDLSDGEPLGAALATQAALSWTPRPGFRVTLAGANLLEPRTRLSIAPPVDRRVWVSLHATF